MVALLCVVLNETAVLATVTVPVPELVSKVTVSAFVGAAVPPAPPDAVAQLVVVVASQVPAPPTQNFAAIF
jgi:hypothetical protein